ncbi:hypothetical protein VNO77_20112 [Canavalia gladiata]|uniref:Uncharacterized protein n=1 Tax=Canavalia gladiata TaxID=3824 RepID=A0AAN9LS80_CANGL
MNTLGGFLGFSGGGGEIHKRKKTKKEKEEALLERRIISEFPQEIIRLDGKEKAPLEFATHYSLLRLQGCNDIGYKSAIDLKPTKECSLQKLMLGATKAYAWHRQNQPGSNVPRPLMFRRF